MSPIIVGTWFLGITGKADMNRYTTFIGRPELLKLFCYHPEMEVVLNCQNYESNGNINVSIPGIESLFKIWI